MVSEYCIDVILSIQDYDLEGYIINLNDDKMTIVISGYEQCIYNGGDVLIKIPIENKGVDVYKGTVEGILKNRVYIKDAILLEKEQRRKEVRVTFEEEFRVNQVFIAGMLRTLPKCIIFESVNISVSGILLRSELQIPSNIELLLDLSCIQKDLHFTVKIVRICQNEDIFHYGCSFTDINESSLSLLRQFVFSQQIKLIRSKRAM